jgi:uncharacterized membrane protein
MNGGSFPNDFQRGETQWPFAASAEVKWQRARDSAPNVVRHNPAGQWRNQRKVRSRVTGIIFFLIDKRPFVRFHAAQSIVVFGGLHVINIVIGIAFGAGFMMMGGFGAFGMGWALYSLISLVAFILWILLMVKAYQHEKFEVPVAAGIAKSFAGN